MLKIECSGAQEVRRRTQALIEAIVVLCDLMPMVAANAQAGIKLKTMETVISDLRELSDLIEDRGSETLKQIETGTLLQDKLKSIITTPESAQPARTLIKN